MSFEFTVLHLTLLPLLADLVAAHRSQWETEVMITVYGFGMLGHIFL